MSAPGITALWKSGSIASEPELTIEDEEFFWIDANTRSGMSGSPVVARRFGSALYDDGSMGVYGGIVDRIVGVYAGRAYNAPDMTLGRVWKWKGVQEVIASAVSKCRRGVIRPHPCQIGHYLKTTMPTVNIDITKTAKVLGVNQAGASQQMEITLDSIFREAVLTDDRFGLNLNRVRLAAAIEAALEDAVTNKKLLELTEEQYGLVREAVENPSKPYNPMLARSILPLLEHIIEAGRTP